jgi:outer membrane protein OmpA-like peptidoglycan-associated protein
MKREYAGLAAVFCLAVAGCTTTTPQSEPQSPTVGLTKPVDPPKNPDIGHYQNRTEVDALYNLWLAPSVMSICSGPSPFFSYDSSKPDTQSQPTMQNLVDCMRTGPLVGKTIMLIGRTDPRGSEDYNLKLGRERAERVKKYLVANGGDPQRIVTDSIGKHDAHTDPADWPADRRVQITLATPGDGRTVSVAEKP